MDMLSQYMEALLASEYRRQITHHRVLPGRSAVWGESRRPWPRAVVNLLEAAGIAEAGQVHLYVHQARATDLIRAGRDVVVTTPTASGKSLIYHLPVLEKLLHDPDARALYIFPLKALAQDQKNSLLELCAPWPEEARPKVELYDGDVSAHFRSKIRKNPPQVLITNPEMLHLAILPGHEQWTTFLANLAYVVVDEAHMYRGVFGAHVAQLLWRLGRVCGRYNARPVHVLCTATVGNPGELARNLLGREVEEVSESGAPQGPRHMVFLDPEDSPATLAIRLLKAALGRGLRTIVYCRSRRMTELISMWATDKAGEYKNRISAYRAGFLPEERREIESRMASGSLLAVVSTSALELGIDIGGLDLCLLVGYPGTVVSTLQRGGRVGRSGRASAVALIAGEDALDQFFIHNPEEFFSRPPEKAVLNPDNPVILARHAECAAAEMEIRRAEPGFSPALEQALHELEAEGLALRSADGQGWLAARKRPQRHVDLRGAGATFTLVDLENKVIGTMDAGQAFREAHPGAVYLHRGRTWRIDSLDLGAKLARAVPENCAWHTRVRTSKSTEILDCQASAWAYGAPVYFGKLRVTEVITGYERRLNGSLKLLDIQPLDLPPQVFTTEGLWFTVPDPVRLRVEEELLHFMGSIHALEHLAIGLMPLLVMADRNDFGGISIPMHAQTGAPSVFVYDGLPGGAGLTRAAFPLFEDLMRSMYATLSTCPCETGCPSCVHSPKCGSGNRPIDKQGALVLLEGLMELRGAPPPSDSPRQGIESPAPPSFPAAGPGEMWNDEAPRPGFAPSPCGGKMAGRGKGISPMPEGILGERKKMEATEEQKMTEKKEYQRVMVLDVETRRSAAEVGGWHKADKMGVSVTVLWDQGEFLAYEQDDLGNMFEKLKEADLVVGFNISRFDYTVLQPFAKYDLRELNTLDMLQVVKDRLNYRLSLDSLAKATLDAPKSADGLQALEWWKQGRMDLITKYCRDDVDITRRLYEFGRDNGYLLFVNKAGQKVRVPVSW